MAEEERPKPVAAKSWNTLLRKPPTINAALHDGSDSPPPHSPKLNGTGSLQRHLSMSQHAPLRGGSTLGSLGQLGATTGVRPHSSVPIHHGGLLGPGGQAAGGNTAAEVVNAVKTLRKTSIVFATSQTGPALRSRNGSLAVYFYAPNPNPGKGVTFSPDGAYVMRWGYGTDVKLISSEDGMLMMNMVAPGTGAVRYAAFNADSSQLAAATEDCKVYVWLIANRQLVSTIDVGAEPLAYVVFSSDNRQLLSCDDDGQLELWSVSSAQMVRRYETGHTSKRCGFSPDGKLVLSCAGDDCSLVLLNAGENGNMVMSENFEEVQEARNRANYCVSPDGTKVLVYIQEQVYTTNLIVFNTTSETTIRLQVCNGFITHADFSADGSLFVTAGRDDLIHVWDSQSGILQHTLEGHSSDVMFCKINGDGTVAVSGDSEGVVLVWDLEAGQCTMRLQAHTCPVVFCDLVPDGTRALTVDSEGHAYLWFLDAARLFEVLRQHSDLLCCIAPCPDGGSLMVGYKDGSLRGWDIGSGPGFEATVNWIHTKQVCPVERLAVRPDGSHVASAGRDGIILITDILSGSVLHSLRGHREHVTGLCYGERGDVLASATRTGDVYLWNARSYNILPVHQFRVPDGIEVVSLALSPGQTAVTAATAAGTVHSWGLPSGNVLLSIKVTELPATQLRYSSDGSCLAVGSADGTVALVDAANGQRLSQLEGNASGINNLQFVTRSAGGPPNSAATQTNNNMTRAAGLGDTELHLLSLCGRQAVTWDCSRGTKEHLTDFIADGCNIFNGGASAMHQRSFVAHDAAVLYDPLNYAAMYDMQPRPPEQHPGNSYLFKDGTALSQGANGCPLALFCAPDTTVHMLTSEQGGTRVLDFSSDGRLLVSGTLRGELCVWDVAHQQLLHKWPAHKRSAITCVRFTHDGACVYSCGEDCKVILWDWRRQSVVAVLTGHQAPVAAVEMSVSGDELASGDRDGFIFIWDTAKNEPKQVIPAHDGAVLCCSLSPCGTMVASSGADEHIVVLDTKTGQALVCLDDAMDGKGLTIKFSFDGTKLQVGGEKGSILIWDIAHNCLLYDIAAHEGKVYDCSWSGDSRRLLSVGSDGRARLWDTAAGSELCQANFERVLGAVESGGFVKCDLSATGNRMAGCTAKGQLIDWDVGAELRLVPEGSMLYQWLSAMSIGKARETYARLLQLHPLLINSQDSRGWTILMHAAAQSNPEITKLIISNVPPGSGRLGLTASAVQNSVLSSIRHVSGVRVMSGRFSLERGTADATLGIFGSVRQRASEAGGVQSASNKLLKTSPSKAHGDKDAASGATTAGSAFGRFMRRGAEFISPSMRLSGQGAPAAGAAFNDSGDDGMESKGAVDASPPRGAGGSRPAGEARSSGSGTDALDKDGADQDVGQDGDARRRRAHLSIMLPTDSASQQKEPLASAPSPSHPRVGALKKSNLRPNSPGGTGSPRGVSISGAAAVLPVSPPGGDAAEGAAPGGGSGAARRSVDIALTAGAPGDSPPMSTRTSSVATGGPGSTSNGLPQSLPMTHSAPLSVVTGSKHNLMLPVVSAAAHVDEDDDSDGLSRSASGAIMTVAASTNARVGSALGRQLRQAVAALSSNLLPKAANVPDLEDGTMIDDGALVRQVSELGDDDMMDHHSQPPPTPAASNHPQPISTAASIRRPPSGLHTLISGKGDPFVPAAQPGGPKRISHTGGPAKPGNRVWPDPHGATSALPERERQEPNAVRIALNAGSADCVQHVLDAVLAGRVTPGSYHAITLALPAVALHYPTMCQTFLNGLPLKPLGEMEIPSHIAARGMLVRSAPSYTSYKEMWASELRLVEGDKNPMALMEACMVQLPFAAAIGKSSVLHTLVESDVPVQTYGSDTIKAIIDYKWRSFAQRRVYFKSMLYLIFTLLFTAFAVLFSNDVAANQATLEELLTTGAGIAQVVFATILFLYGVYYLFMECVQLWALGPAAYFDSFWNLVDLAAYMTTLVICPCVIFRVGVGYHGFVPVLIAAETLMLWLKLLFYGLAMDGVGTFIFMTAEIISGMKYFIGLLAALFISFAVAFMVLFRNESVGNEGMGAAYDDFGSALLNVYLVMFSIGDPHDALDTEYSHFAILLFCVYMFALLVVMLNMLITLMADIFQKVKGAQQYVFLKGRAELIIEVESTTHVGDASPQNHPYLHILMPLRKAGEPGPGAAGLDDAANEAAKIERAIAAVMARLNASGGLPPSGGGGGGGGDGGGGGGGGGGPTGLAGTSGRGTEGRSLFGGEEEDDNSSDDDGRSVVSRAVSRAASFKSMRSMAGGGGHHVNPAGVAAGLGYGSGALGRRNAGGGGGDSGGMGGMGAGAISLRRRTDQQGAYQLGGYGPQGGATMRRTHFAGGPGPSISGAMPDMGQVDRLEKQVQKLTVTVTQLTTLLARATDGSRRVTDSTDDILTQLDMLAAGQQPPSAGRPRPALRQSHAGQRPVSRGGLGPLPEDRPTSGRPGSRPGSARETPRSVTLATPSSFTQQGQPSIRQGQPSAPASARSQRLPPHSAHSQAQSHHSGYTPRSGHASFTTAYARRSLELEPAAGSGAVSDLAGGPSDPDLDLLAPPGTAGLGSSPADFVVRSESSATSTGAKRGGLKRAVTAGQAQGPPEESSAATVRTEAGAAGSTTPEPSRAPSTAGPGPQPQQLLALQQHLALQQSGSGLGAVPRPPSNLPTPSASPTPPPHLSHHHLAGPVGAGRGVAPRIPSASRTLEGLPPPPASRIGSAGRRESPQPPPQRLVLDQEHAHAGTLPQAQGSGQGQVVLGRRSTGGYSASSGAGVPVPDKEDSQTQLPGTVPVELLDA